VDRVAFVNFRSVFRGILDTAAVEAAMGDTRESRMTADAP
jgi:hypothetical protein